MINLKVFLLALLLINGLSILSLSLSYLHEKRKQTGSSSSFRGNTVTHINITSPYKFDDFFIAHNLLQQLDVFESMGPHDYSEHHYAHGLFWGFRKDDTYCETHRFYFATNPEFIFEEMNFLVDELDNHLLRTRIIPAVGNDIHPEIGSDMDKEIRDSFSLDLKPNINIFYTNPFVFERRAIGVGYSCLTQISNHILGNYKMSRKDSVGEALFEYTKTYASRPTCFNKEKFFPQTWVLTHEDQCKQFFTEFNSAKYQALKKQRGIVYFRKIGYDFHKGEGVFQVDDTEEKYIRQVYRNGTLCGKVEDNNVMQWSIHNPLLLQGRKFDMRIHMLIASTNPLIAYYHDGLIGLSLHEYDSASKEKGVFLTNVAINKPLFQIAEQNGTYKGLTVEEMKEKTCWSYTRLHEYLEEQGKVSDPNWLDNYLRKEIKRVLIHLIRMGQDTLTKKSSLSELYGVDIMMDEDLGLWFIEANARPAVQGWTKQTHDYFFKMLIDSFEILFGLLRSRTKRIINYINYLTKLEGGWNFNPETNRFEVVNVEQRRAEFKELTMNWFEPEFEPRPDNGFMKIVDEHLSGVDRYMGLIDEECL